MQVSTWMDDYFRTIGVARSYSESICFSSCFQRRNTFEKITINDHICLFRFHHRRIFKSKSVRAPRRISWEREVHSPHCESRGTSKGRLLESTAARKNTLSGSKEVLERNPALLQVTYSIYPDTHTLRFRIDFIRGYAPAVNALFKILDPSRAERETRRDGTWRD